MKSNLCKWTFLYPNVKVDLNKWMPLIKWILVIPHIIVLCFLEIGAIILSIFPWFAILCTGRYPKGIFDFVEGALRWSLRVTAYAILLTTDEYPPFRLSEYWRGQWLCGKVTFEITGERLGIYHYHCSQCRKRTGTAFNSGPIIQPETFKWLSGETQIACKKAKILIEKISPKQIRSSSHRLSW